MWSFSEKGEGLGEELNLLAYRHSPFSVVASDFALDNHQHV